MSADRGHYSYTTYADPETARTFDARRFGGPIGELIADTQARVLTEFLAPLHGRTVVDVGAGTGRASLLLARAGGQVTALDASQEMLSVAERRAAQEGLPIQFVVGDAHRLQFADRSFDAAISLRVLMHTPEWRQCLGELCRVARRLVVIDYPSAHSFALLESIGRRIARACGVDTEAYRVFADGSIVGELERHGFRIRSRHRQFVLPIAAHKAIGSRMFTERTEHVFAVTGMLRLLGSPVTIVAERCESS